MEDSGELYLTNVDDKGHRVVETKATPGAYGYEFPKNAWSDLLTFLDALPSKNVFRDKFNMDAAYETAFGIRNHLTHDYHQNPIPLFTINEGLCTDSVRDAVYSKIINYGLPKLTNMSVKELLSLHPAEFARWFKIAKQNDLEKTTVASIISGELDD